MKITNSEIKFSLQNKNYLNFPIIHQHTSKKTVHRSSSCSSFLDRNYNKFSQEQKSKRAAHAYILSQDNLNALLCKLKNYYNEVLCTTTARQRLRQKSDTRWLEIKKFVFQEKQDRKLIKKGGDDFGS